jgi:CheY-like chemotaxis protein
VPPSHRRLNILAVEDNPGDVFLIREAFRECGHDCNLDFVDTAQAAQALLASQSFDLVLSDMGLRNGESAELIRTIRSDDRLKTTPVIVLSGAADPAPAYAAGANAFISKTMDMDEFFAKIQALMYFWIRVAELPVPRQLSL